jgi:hypothetical protein
MLGVDRTCDRHHETDANDPKRTLLGALAEQAADRVANAKIWPNSPRALAGRLRPEAEARAFACCVVE